MPSKKYWENEANHYKAVAEGWKSNHDYVSETANWLRADLAELSKENERLRKSNEHLQAVFAEAVAESDSRAEQVELVQSWYEDAVGDRDVYEYAWEKAVAERDDLHEELHMALDNADYWHQAYAEDVVIGLDPDDEGYGVLNETELIDEDDEQDFKTTVLDAILALQNAVDDNNAELEELWAHVDSNN